MRRSERIHREVSGWEGVTAHPLQRSAEAKPSRLGSTEYRLGRREIGHVHGERSVDIPFPKRVRDDLVTNGEAAPHHVLPESGWVSVHLRGEGDVARATALLRRSYELATAQAERRASQQMAA